MKQISITALLACAGLYTVRVNAEGYRPSPGDIDTVQSMYGDAGEPTDSKHSRRPSGIRRRAASEWFPTGAGELSGGACQGCDRRLRRRGQRNRVRRRR